MDPMLDRENVMPLKSLLENDAVARIVEGRGIETKSTKLGQVLRMCDG